MTDVSVEELVVLLDEQGREIGTAPKSSVHSAATPLHRAFSCYLFGPDDQLLLTRRALTKATFPGIWTNSFCGHPAPGESDEHAIRRRARAELGLDVTDIRIALPHFRYRAESGGIVENEICPVYLARTDQEPQPHRDEVEDHRWSAWTDFTGAITEDPAGFSPWAQEQTSELVDGPSVRNYLQL